MNNPTPSTEALNDEEREFARIARALPGGEPSAELDARILKAAGNAAATSRRPRSRWIGSGGAMWGLGAAAAAVLALGVGWQLMVPAHRSVQPEAAPASADSNAEPSIQPAPPQEPAPPAVAAAPAEAVPAPFPARQMDEPVAASEQAAPAAKAMAEAEPPQPAAAKLELSEQAAASDAATAGMVTGGSAARSMQPDDWLAHVRQLRDQDRAADARASLLEFRERYPDLAIPPDLAPLLRE